MPRRFACLHCRQLIQYDSSLAGSVSGCPHCGLQIQFPPNPPPQNESPQSICPPFLLNSKPSPGRNDLHRRSGRKPPKSSFSPRLLAFLAATVVIGCAFAFFIVFGDWTTLLPGFRQKPTIRPESTMRPAEMGAFYGELSDKVSAALTAAQQAMYDEGQMFSDSSPRVKANLRKASQYHAHVERVSIQLEANGFDRTSCEAAKIELSAALEILLSSLDGYPGNPIDPLQVKGKSFIDYETYSSLQVGTSTEEDCRRYIEGPDDEWQEISISGDDEYRVKTVQVSNGLKCVILSFESVGKAERWKLSAKAQSGL